jgi:hypothetical protein
MGAAAAVPAALAVPVPAVAAEAPPPPSRADLDADPPDRFCTTSLLSAEEMAAGATSTIVCYDTFEASMRSLGVDYSDLPTERSGDQLVTRSGTGGYVAVHFRESWGGGESLAIEGNQCAGGGVSFAPGDYWNDTFRSTSNRACSTVKHWSDADYQGDMVVTSGSALSNLGGVSGRVSSIKYFGPVN